MESASRHAQRVASNFLNDLDTFREASRARDVRAMSHFDRPVMIPESPALHRRRHSLSTHSLRSHSAAPRTYVDPYLMAYQPPVMHSKWSTVPSYNYGYPSPVTMVGRSSSLHPHYYHHAPSYNPYLSRVNAMEQAAFDHALPTSNLRAHAPPRSHLVTTGTEDYLRYSPLRRAYSTRDLYDDYEEIVPRRSTYRHHTPYRHVSRMSSVPPSASVYRPVSYYTSDVGYAPTTRYNSTRYYATPHYETTYAEPTTSRHYYYPTTTTRSYVTPSYVSSIPYTSEVQYMRRKIDSRLDDALSYKLPPAEYYHDMRSSLRGIRDRMDEHRRLLDRYTDNDLIAPVTSTSSVADRIESKCEQLSDRRGRIRS